MHQKLGHLGTLPHFKLPNDLIVSWGAVLLSDWLLIWFFLARHWSHILKIHNYSEKSLSLILCIFDWKVLVRDSYHSGWRPFEWRWQNFLQIEYDCSSLSDRWLVVLLVHKCNLDLAVARKNLKQLRLRGLDFIWGKTSIKFWLSRSLANCRGDVTSEGFDIST